MMFTFYKAQGLNVGKSLIEEDKIDLARSLLDQAKNKILLPIDCVISDVFDFKNLKVGNLQTVEIRNIPDNGIGLDIGPKSLELYSKELESAKTVVWNGPMGVFEITDTAKGTLEIAKQLAKITKKGAITIVGGGDSASSIERANLQKEISHVSTGGGASLEFLEGKILPGISILDKK